MDYKLLKRTAAYATALATIAGATLLFPSNLSNSTLPEDLKPKKRVEKKISEREIIYDLFKKNLLEDIIYTESRGDTLATSDVGARGEMQIREITWNQYNPEMPFDSAYVSKYNRKTGLDHLMWVHDYLSKRSPEWKSATIEEKVQQILAGYNWGHDNFRKVKFDLKRIPKSVKKYIHQILYSEKENII